MTFFIEITHKFNTLQEQNSECLIQKSQNLTFISNLQTMPREKRTAFSSRKN